MMKNGLAGLMKQAQAMQENIKKTQDQLASLEFEGESGAGLVKIRMTGSHEVRQVFIDQSLLDDKEMLEDLIAAAFNDGLRRSDHATKERMAQVTAGMNLPPGMKLPF